MIRGKHKAWIIGLILIMVIAIAGKLVTDAMRNYLKAIDDDIYLTQIRRTDLVEQIRANKHFLEKWNTISAFQNESLEDRRTKFSAYLDGLEAERAFNFDNLGAPSERPMPGSAAFQELSYELRFSANLEDLLHFLSRLDQSARLLRIDKLEVTRNPGGYRPRFSMPLTSTKQLSILVVVTIPTIRADITPLDSKKLLP